MRQYNYMNDSTLIVERLGTLFSERFQIQVPSADTDLLETGILDSLQLVELLLQLEKDFGYRIDIETMELDDLRTLARLAKAVVAQTDAARSIRAG